MKLLPPQITLNSLLEYNPITGSLIWKYRHRSLFISDKSYNTWNTRFASKPALTAINKKGYKFGTINGIPYLAHRIIYKMLYNLEPDQIDHDDGNPANNISNNLSDVSNHQNNLNKKTPITNTTGHIGIVKRHQKWIAQIKYKQKVIHLGIFDNLNDAIIARKSAEQKYGFHTNHGR